MIYDKIFVIGFNKTGTSSFHSLFQNLNLKSQHDNIWNIDEYQCFSDGYHSEGKYKQYYRSYPNSLFILNTRPLNNWLVSRSKHCYLYKKSWGWPPSEHKYVKWINHRNSHFNDILNFFVEAPNNLVICNIEKLGWTDFICSTIKYSNLSENIHCNKIDVEQIDTKIMQLINNEIQKAYLKIQLSEKEQNSLIPSNINSKLYKTFL